MPTITRLSFIASAAFVATMLCTPAAQASIIYSPASIVTSQDGTYITDTVNNRDWYKFDNTLSTLGKSLNTVTAMFSGSNWSVASRAQVQSLQGQFGWTVDTLTSGLNANFGLTSAMGDFLGLTGTYSVMDGQYLQTGRFIEAMTSDAGLEFDNSGQLLNEYRFTTMSRNATYIDVDADGNDVLFGDYVKGEFNFLNVTTGANGVGTWLSREHVVDTGGGGVDVDCGRLAPCPNDVPEPASYALIGIALMGLAFTQARRSA